MSDHETFMLVPSSNPGRFALNTANGRDLTSGDTIEILLGGVWIPGHVEHGGSVYPDEGYYADPPPYARTAKPGYYFMAAGDDTTCGLCVGMQVRLP